MWSSSPNPFPLHLPCFFLSAHQIQRLSHAGDILTAVFYAGAAYETQGLEDLEQNMNGKGFIFLHDTRWQTEVDG